MHPLESVRILSTAINLPGPLAVSRLRQLGAAVTKVEPPDGDPLNLAKPDWYLELHEGVEIVRLNLKKSQARAELDQRLERADLFISATRPAGLQRLGLAWPELHVRHPHLSQVAIVGHGPPNEEMPGHDLTYQAECGLLTPPHLPRACVADWAGAQEVVIVALSLMLERPKSQSGKYAQVSLAEAANRFAEPIRRGLTGPGGLLGGGLPAYNLFRTLDGWIAIAALEPHFWQKLCHELRLAEPTHGKLQESVLQRTSAEWEAWAKERDLPLVRVREG